MSVSTHRKQSTEKMLARSNQLTILVIMFEILPWVLPPFYQYYLVRNNDLIINNNNNNDNEISGKKNVSKCLYQLLAKLTYNNWINLVRFLCVARVVQEEIIDLVQTPPLHRNKILCLDFEKNQKIHSSLYYSYKPVFELEWAITIFCIKRRFASFANTPNCEINNNENQYQNKTNKQNSQNNHSIKKSFFKTINKTHNHFNEKQFNWKIPKQIW